MTDLSKLTHTASGRIRVESYIWVILGINPEKTKFKKTHVPPKFTEALFTTARHGHNINVH